MIVTVLLHFQIIKVRLGLAVSVAQGYQSVADGASFEVIMMLLIATIYRVTTLCQGLGVSFSQVHNKVCFPYMT